MEHLRNIDTLVEKIQALESKKREAALALREEKQLIWTVNKVPLGNLRIGGEDGGITKKCTHLVDFVFLRAVSAIFEYRGGKLFDVKYYPSMSPSPEMDYSTDPLSEAEFGIFWSLRRLKKELGLSVDTIKKHAPDVFLLDGSLIIHPGDVPKSESAVYGDYEEVKAKIAELYELGRQKSCLIAGVVEDSRSSAFCNFVKKEILEKNPASKLNKWIEVFRKTKDTNLLHYMLKKGEATAEIELGDGIKCIYMKTAEFDRPIRIEYMGDGKRVAEIIFTLSCESRTYGFPNVLIEADQRAKLSEADFLYYTNHIAARLGIHDLFFLRRENRPF
ncbi:MAG: DNA double-strand break repair nuclease NurA [Candidatus Aenigmarchaeota archaeon]|nr:DNA double-strand break repair nuclease NurA [Candidatus Aenigmarchaeota archaeon]